MIIVKIKYFGEIADTTSCSAEEIRLNTGTVSELISHLETSYGLHADDMHIAINHEIISEYVDIRVNEHDEVAVLSPFAGG